MNPEDNSTFTKLVTANGLAEADVWKAVLEASGIQVFLQNETMATVIPETAGEIAAVDLWVPREQAAEALQILQDERVEPADEDDPV
jgi:Putative prokaryotic signal transducing protein